MLSRTADSLFWLARSIERAENMARLIEMGRRLRATPGGKETADGAAVSPWPAVLSASGVQNPAEVLGDAPTTRAEMVDEQRRAILFMLLDRDNPSSVISCIETARFNARSVRAALTVEMWEAVNDAWIEFRALTPAQLENGAMGPLLEWIKQRGAMLRGAADSTALRNDGFEFQRLGSYIERLDATARLIDVLSGGVDGGAVHDDDPYAWVAILRAAGVLRAYHAAYSADYDHRKVLDFLVLNPYCPRSLAHCAERTVEHLNALARFYGRREGCHINAGAISALLSETSADDVLDNNLHAFLSDIIRRNNRLAMEIGLAYHFAPSKPSAAQDAEEEAEPTQAPSGQAQEQNLAKKLAAVAAE